VETRTRAKKDRTAPDLSFQSWRSFLEAESAAPSPREHPSLWESWQSQRGALSVGSAAQFLASTNRDLSDYFLYCQIYALRPWVVGIPPAWQQSWWWGELE